MLATSDVPGGVVNLVTGSRRELVSHLAGHMDVNGLDAFGLDPAEAAAVEELGSENVKRIARPPSTGSSLRLALGDGAVAVPHWALRRDQDRLAPHRRLSRAR